MSLVALFVGLPITIVLIVLSASVTVIGIILYKKIKIRIFGIIVFILFSIPFSAISAYYIAGIITAFKFLKINSFEELPQAIGVSFLLGTLNIIIPGNMPLMTGGNGEFFDTSELTLNSFYVVFFICLIFIFIYDRKYLIKSRKKKGKKNE